GVDVERGRRVRVLRHGDVAEDGVRYPQVAPGRVGRERIAELFAYAAAVRSVEGVGGQTGRGVRPDPQVARGVVVGVERVAGDRVRSGRRVEEHGAGEGVAGHLGVAGARDVGVEIRVPRERVPLNERVGPRGRVEAVDAAVADRRVPDGRRRRVDPDIGGIRRAGVFDGDVIEDAGSGGLLIEIDAVPLPRGGRRAV